MESEIFYYILFFIVYIACSNDFMIHFWDRTYSWRNTAPQLTNLLTVNKY